MKVVNEGVRGVPAAALRPYCLVQRLPPVGGGGGHRGLPSPYLTLIFTLHEPLMIATHPDPGQPGPASTTRWSAGCTRPGDRTHPGLAIRHPAVAEPARGASVARPAGWGAGPPGCAGRGRVRAAGRRDPAAGPGRGNLAGAVRAWTRCCCAARVPHWRASRRRSATRSAKPGGCCCGPAARCGCGAGRWVRLEHPAPAQPAAGRDGPDPQGGRPGDPLRPGPAAAAPAPGHRAELASLADLAAGYGYYDQAAPGAGVPRAGRLPPAEVAGGRVPKHPRPRGRRCQAAAHDRTNAPATAGVAHAAGPRRPRPDPFLVEAFGFDRDRRLRRGRRVHHAELAWPLGGGIMLGSAPRPRTTRGRCGRHVRRLRGHRRARRAVARARAAGAEGSLGNCTTPTTAPATSPPATRGQPWSFGTYRGEAPAS